MDWFLYDRDLRHERFTLICGKAWKKCLPELFLELHIVVIVIPNLIQISLIKSTSYLFPVFPPFLINMLDI